MVHVMVQAAASALTHCRNCCKHCFPAAAHSQAVVATACPTSLNMIVILQASDATSALGAQPTDQRQKSDCHPDGSATVQLRSSVLHCSSSSMQLCHAASQWQTLQAGGLAAGMPSRQGCSSERSTVVARHRSPALYIPSPDSALATACHAHWAA